MRLAIVGARGSGKSTLFRAFTGAEPGYGQGPSVSVVRVRDERLEWLRDKYEPKKYTPVALEVSDFPGLPDPGETSGVKLSELAGVEQLPPMETCLSCHDGTSAPGDCATCHQGGRGGTIRTTSSWSPRALPLPARPLPRNRSLEPPAVPAGTVTVDWPSIVGTSTRVPRAASVILNGRSR